MPKKPRFATQKHAVPRIFTHVNGYAGEAREIGSNLAKHPLSSLWTFRRVKKTVAEAWGLANTRQVQGGVLELRGERFERGAQAKVIQTEAEWDELRRRKLRGRQHDYTITLVCKAQADAESEDEAAS